MQQPQDSVCPEVVQLDVSMENVFTERSQSPLPRLARTSTFSRLRASLLPREMDFLPRTTVLPKKSSSDFD